jgi:ribose 5-phosphate isomerase B
MRVAVAYDHRGRKAVELVRTVIAHCGHEYLDLGPEEDRAVDCPDFAYLAARAVAQHEADTAVLLCNTGIGMSMSANKVKGARAARCCDEFDVRAARQDYDANVLCLSGELLERNALKKSVEVWLTTVYERRNRSQRMIHKIMAIEAGDDPRLIRCGER